MPPKIEQTLTTDEIKIIKELANQTAHTSESILFFSLTFTQEKTVSSTSPYQFHEVQEETRGSLTLNTETNTIYGEATFLRFVLSRLATSTAEGVPLSEIGNTRAIKALTRASENKTPTLTEVFEWMTSCDVYFFLRLRNFGESSLKKTLLTMAKHLFPLHQLDKTYFPYISELVKEEKITDNQLTDLGFFEEEIEALLA